MRALQPKVNRKGDLTHQLKETEFDRLEVLLLKSWSFMQLLFNKSMVQFGIKVVSGSDGKKHWIGGEDIKAVAHDVPIPGYKTKTTINLRLWSTKAASEDFDLYTFNAGRHTEASEALANAEKSFISSKTYMDLLKCIWKNQRSSLPRDRVCKRGQDPSSQATIEKWSLDLMQKLLPRHIEIIEMIDEEALVVDDIRALQLIRTILAEYGTTDSDLLENKLKEMRILENVELPEEFADELQSSEQVEEEEEKKDDEENKDDDNDEVEGAIAEKKGTDESSIEDEKEELPVSIPEPPKVRMANLCVVGGHAVNGVAEIHSEIVKDEFVENEDLQLQWREAKRSNKVKVAVAAFIREKTGYFVSPDAMFDIQDRVHGHPAVAVYGYPYYVNLF
ncbi:hypothetical protein V8G54_012027 [Vigna mungo]|uniref:Alpha-1,4 glucan phosphorylase n=1 Tax=Vigna mungo TaxID=3915 RepID=A0AAQ3S3F3_VIGMU